MIGGGRRRVFLIGGDIGGLVGGDGGGVNDVDGIDVVEVVDVDDGVGAENLNVNGRGTGTPAGTGDTGGTAACGADAGDGVGLEGIIGDEGADVERDGRGGNGGGVTTTDVGVAAAGVVDLGVGV
jgi:hypothetical protein